LKHPTHYIEQANANTMNTKNVLAFLKTLNSVWNFFNRNNLHQDLRTLINAEETQVCRLGSLIRYNPYVRHDRVLIRYNPYVRHDRVVIRYNPYVRHDRVLIRCNPYVRHDRVRIRYNPYVRHDRVLICYNPYVRHDRVMIRCNPYVRHDRVLIRYNPYVRHDRVLIRYNPYVRHDRVAVIPVLWLGFCAYLNGVLTSFHHHRIFLSEWKESINTWAQRQQISRKY
jgi:hypothetical protein